MYFFEIQNFFFFKKQVFFFYVHLRSLTLFQLCWLCSFPGAALDVPEDSVSGCGSIESVGGFVA